MKKRDAAASVDAVATVIAGLFITLSLAPFNVWPLAIVAAALLFRALGNAPPARFFWLALLFSATLFLSGASWVYVSIHEFGFVAAPLAALLTALFALGLALVNALAWMPYAIARRPKTADKRFSPRDILLFAAAGSFAEWLRSWLWSGFPWLYIGYSQTDSLLAGWAPLVGVYGISFILFASGAALYALSCIGLRKLRAPGNAALKLCSAALLVCWLGGPALGKLSFTRPSGAAHTVSLVQTNISQHNKWQPALLADSLKLYADMSSSEWPHSELVIWPEAAIANEYHASQAFLQRMADVASHYNSALITGIPYRAGEAETGRRAIYNSVVAVGDGEGIYHKQNLVPFGEFIPLENAIGKLIAVFNLPLSSMRAGAPEQAPLKLHNWQSRPLICYEIVYPALTARTAAISDVLITVSNDAWFGASLGPVQHLQMARMRAIETGRYVLRSTGNGISAVIDTHGGIVARTAQFERATLRAQFFLTDGLTPWTRAGYWLVPALNCALLIGLVMLNVHARRKADALQA